jgi:Cu(I)/Ag(I) efflux system membrane fusion protein
MNNSLNWRVLVLPGFLLLALGASAGWWWGQRTAIAPHATVPAAGNTEQTILYWYDPMQPQHHFDKPGKSPFMDMELVPRYANEEVAGSAAGAGVRVDPQIAQNIGLRAAVVEHIALESVIEASGLLAFNARDFSIEQVRSAGLVERVWPLAPGDVIAAGQPLVELLVPAWTAAQSEFLALRAGGDSALAAAARARLRILGLSAAEIEELERSRRAQTSFVVRSSRAGVLQSLDVRSGMTLAAGQTLAQVQGIDTLWLEVAVPENRAQVVQLGADAEATLAAYPGLAVRGKIIAVLPELAANSRTLRVRIELPNTNGRLRAGMSAQVRLVAKTTGDALAVPTEAIIRTGRRALVMVLLDDGGFVPVEITLGQEIKDRTVVTSGLAAGQRIVSSAQFLLDSEANLNAVFPTPAATPVTTPPEPQDATTTRGEQP